VSRRPNILILMADQLAASALPAWGNQVARTPRIDRLAEHGVVFRHFHCASPLCAPARAVLMSGLLPSRSGVYDNAAHFAADIPTFAHYLRAAGYRTILAGKMHFCGPDQLHGFEERLTTDIYPADFGWTPDWDRPEHRPDWYHNMSSVTEAGLCVRSNQIDFDDEVAFLTRRQIFDIARDSDPRPFCLVVSFAHPHDPFAITAEYWNRFPHEAIDMPQNDQAPADPHSLRLRHMIGLDERPVTAEEVRRARHAYYGALAYVDDRVGEILDALAACALAEDTIAIFLADHGELLGEHGLWYKMSFFEPATRVPLIVSAPRLFSPRMVEGAASLLDLLPTLAAIAGDGAEPDYAIKPDGRSLLPELSGQAGQDLALGEYLAEGAIAPIVMIRRDQWKFIHCPADPDQLYDLAADPDERRNLGQDPADAGIVSRFRAEVAQGWDLPALDRAVRESQKRRHFVAASLQQGRVKPWEFQPFVDASRQYMRNHLKLDELEARARFPRATG
jgi:choline-sulfatase